MRSLVSPSILFLRVGEKVLGRDQVLGFSKITIPLRQQDQQSPPSNLLSYYFKKIYWKKSNTALLWPSGWPDG